MEPKTYWKITIVFLAVYIFFAIILEVREPENVFRLVVIAFLAIATVLFLAKHKIGRYLALAGSVLIVLIGMYWVLVTGFYMPIFSPQALMNTHIDRLIVSILEITLGETVFFTVMESRPVFETKALAKQ